MRYLSHLIGRFSEVGAERCKVTLSVSFKVLLSFSTEELLWVWSWTKVVFRVVETACASNDATVRVRFSDSDCSPHTGDGESMLQIVSLGMFHALL